MKLTKIQALGIHQEITSQGNTATILTTDYLPVDNVDVAIEGEVLTRDFRRPSLDSLSHVVGKRSATVKFKTEFKGSGTRGTVTATYLPLDVAIQACGYTSTVVGATSITYAPTSNPVSGFYGPGQSVTIDAYRHGLLHKITGAVGNFRLTNESGNYPMLEFEFKGLYTAVSDQSMPSITSSSVLPVAWASSTVSIQGTSLIVDKWDYSPNNVISIRDDAASANSVKGFVITDRKPGGSYDPEGETVATHDFFGKFISGAEATSSFTVGSASGNTITVTMPKTQYNDVKYADRNGIQVFQIPYVANQSTGDDHISIVVT